YPCPAPAETPTPVAFGPAPGPGRRATSAGQDGAQRRRGPARWAVVAVKVSCGSDARLRAGELGCRGRRLLAPRRAARPPDRVRPGKTCASWTVRACSAHWQPSLAGSGRTLLDWTGQPVTNVCAAHGLICLQVAG